MSRTFCLWLVPRANFLVGSRPMKVSSTSTAPPSAHGRELAGAHRFADAMRHEPRGFESDAQECGEAGCELMPFFDSSNQEHRLQPDVQRDVAALEDGADFDGEGLAALVALVEADAGGLAAASCRCARRRRNAGRPGPSAKRGLQRTRRPLSSSWKCGLKEAMMTRSWWGRRARGAAAGKFRRAAALAARGDLGQLAKLSETHRQWRPQGAKWSQTGGGNAVQIRRCGP